MKKTQKFSWHVADKEFRMVRYYDFLSPAKRRLLEVESFFPEAVELRPRKISGSLAKDIVTAAQFTIF
ncbi:hypothetical protein ABMO82_005145, partial [Escherichia coli]